jgi:hypothetical protein
MTTTAQDAQITLADAVAAVEAACAASADNPSIDVADDATSRLTAAAWTPAEFGRSFRFDVDVPDAASVADLRSVVEWLRGCAYPTVDREARTITVTWTPSSLEGAPRGTHDFAVGYLLAVAQDEVARELESRGWSTPPVPWEVVDR